MITSDLRLSQDGVTSSCWNGKKAKIMVALLPHPNIPWDLITFSSLLSKTGVHFLRSSEVVIWTTGVLWDVGVFKNLSKSITFFLLCDY